MKGNSRTAVYPHADPRVGFILNPAIRSTAMWAENAVEYNINSIGLRGKNIETKAPGVIRIALAPGLVAETPARGSAWLCPKSNYSISLDAD
jgi:hypothetical protein